MPAKNIVIVENEQCHHLLPNLDNTVAILGAGLNLIWMANAHFNDKQIIYWGDIDTWGLKMLAMARHYQPQLRPLLMDTETFDQYSRYAVPEPTVAGSDCPLGLNQHERLLYEKLLQSYKGRLEQERLPAAMVKSQLLNNLS